MAEAASAAEQGATRGLPSPAPAAALTPTAPDSFHAFASLANELKDTPARLDKTEKLRAYFATLAPVSPDAAALASLYFTARPFPQSSALTLNLGWALMQAGDQSGAAEAFRAA